MHVHEHTFEVVISFYSYSLLGYIILQLYIQALIRCTKIMYRTYILSFDRFFIVTKASVSSSLVRIPFGISSPFFLRLSASNVT